MLVVSDNLERVQDICTAVYLAPPLSTWSRLRPCAEEGKLPLHSRSEPFGVSVLEPEAQSKVCDAKASWKSYHVSLSKSCAAAHEPLV